MWKDRFVHNSTNNVQSSMHCSVSVPTKKSHQLIPATYFMDDRCVKRMAESATSFVAFPREMVRILGCEDEGDGEL